MPKRNLIWIGGILLAALVTVWVTRNNAPLPGDPEVANFRPVLDSYRLIRENYFRPVAEDDVKRGAVKGMVEALDEFCSYIPPGRMEAFDSRVMGTECGLGLRIESAGGHVRVIGCLPGSPACSEGLGADDVLVALDGVKVAALPLAKVEAMLQGKAGTSITLSLLRAGEPLTVTLRRREFPVESVQGLYRRADGAWSFALDPARGIVYLRVREFVKNTGEQVQQTLRRLDAPGGVVLDLRGNPGGLLASAVEVSNLFLREGPIVTVVGRDGLPQRYVALPQSALPPVPLVVLIDSRTASAAEIVAGSLKYNQRAVLVGARTCGKGCVQSLFRLGDDMGQINLTTSEYTVGLDERISRRPGSDTWGIDPHEQVILLPSAIEPLARLRLANEVLGRPATRAATADARANPGEKILALDAPLARALELFRAPREMELLQKQAAIEQAKKRAAQFRAATRPEAQP